MYFVHYYTFELLIPFHHFPHNLSAIIAMLLSTWPAAAGTVRGTFFLRLRLKTLDKRAGQLWAARAQHSNKMPGQPPSAKKLVAVQHVPCQGSDNVLQFRYFISEKEENEGEDAASKGGGFVVEKATIGQAAQTGEQPFLLTSPVRWAVSHLLPQNYPRAVSPNYLPYSLWFGAESIASSASGVLSTQSLLFASLLFAVGLGGSTAIPMAAAMNWVIKDGLGQLGGILFASFVSQRFDAEPQVWRFRSAVALDLAVALEILTPLVPGLFLPLAATANVGKNVAWISSSASRAGIHRSMMRHENLSDITAKAGSQTIAASLMGTILGIGLAQVLQGSTPHILATFSILSVFHLSCCYRALRHVVLPTFNSPRFEHIALRYLEDGHVPSPHSVAASQNIIMPNRGPAQVEKVALRVGSPLSDVVQEVSPDARAQSLRQIKDSAKGLQYLLSIARGRNAVDLVFLQSANSHDVVIGFLHAFLLRKQLSADLAETEQAKRSSDTQLIADTASQVGLLRQPFLQALQAQGWDLEHTFLEDRPSRVSFEAE
eukprot:g67056.t1